MSNKERYGNENYWMMYRSDEELALFSLVEIWVDLGLGHHEKIGVATNYFNGRRIVDAMIKADIHTNREHERDD